jgi:hypothetical protein
VYAVRLVVTDKDQASGESVFRSVVVYDPGAGFVTGGGWFKSPTGACTPIPTCRQEPDRAHFEFKSEYKKRAATPTGHTEFRFAACGVDFHGVTQEWLVVAGARAQFKGAGVNNGGGDFGFLVTVIDGRAHGGGGRDKFRIKIWDKNNGNAVVYDNQVSGNTDDSADPTTVIHSGSIVIHRGNGGCPH